MSPIACRRPLAREVYHLVAEDVVSVADVDKALVLGTGPALGHHGASLLLNHLGGGQGGIEHFFEQFTGPMTAWWKVLGSPELTPAVQKKLVDGRSRRGRLPLDRRARGPARRSPARACSNCARRSRAPPRRDESGASALARSFSTSAPETGRGKTMSNALQDVRNTTVGSFSAVAMARLRRASRMRLTAESAS